MPDESPRVPFEELLRGVDALLAAPIDEGARAHTDVVADLLGFLARRMTELHDARQRETGGFLEWLEETIGARLAELSGRTAMHEYWMAPDPASVVLGALEANRRRTTVDVRRPRAYGARNEVRERIAAGVERSMSTLSPILLRIELTDALIDQLAYRMYDLTAAEIALIEGSVPAASGGQETFIEAVSAVAERVEREEA